MSNYTTTLEKPLPPWAVDILRAVPARGGGLNRWLMSAAVALRAAGRDRHDIERELSIATAGEPIRAGEIRRAVERSAEYVRTGGRHTPPAARWPERDEQARARILAEAEGYGAADLHADSPYQCVADEPMTEKIIDALFPGDPLLCVAAEKTQAVTRPRKSFRGRLSELQFIVPSAMSAPTGLNQNGHQSTRCLNNTGPRQYLIVEQDAGPFDEQAAILAHLATRAPLVLVVFSAKKSLHGWFACRGANEATQKQFFSAAVRLGADPATWTRCQLVRMPDGYRPDAKARQSVLYFAPEVVK